MHRDPLKTLGENIKRIRMEKGISQIDLANMCDFEKSNMSRIESGGNNPTLLTMIKIAKALNVSLSEIQIGI